MSYLNFIEIFFLKKDVTKKKKERAKRGEGEGGIAWRSYPVYASTATIAFVPDGYSSMPYFVYELVRTMGLWGVCKYHKTFSI